MHCRPFVDGQEDREGVARLWEIKEDWGAARHEDENLRTEFLVPGVGIG